MNIKSILGTGAFVAAGIVALTVIFGSWYTIDDGYRGVILRNGAVVGTAEPGLNFKTPWIEEVVHVSVRDNIREYGIKHPFEAYSRDQQSAKMKVTVNYRIPADKVLEVYSQYGGEEPLLSRLLDRQVFDKVKTVFGQFSAASAISERARLGQEATAAVMESVDGPLIISSVQLEDIEFSEEYEAAIEQRMKAEVEVATKRQHLERERVEAEIKVTQAQALADSNLAVAKAEAEGIEIKGRAEATAVEVKGRALRDNPSLVGLVQAERWDGQLPKSMIPNGTVPFLDVHP